MNASSPCLHVVESAFAILRKHYLAAFAHEIRGGYSR
jgi:hypothetical protein